MAEEKSLIGVVLSLARGRDPQPYYTLIGLPGETMEQLLNRLEQYADVQRKANGATYMFKCYGGELTHEIAVPQPVLKPIAPIKEGPTAVPNRKVSVPKVAKIVKKQ